MLHLGALSVPSRIRGELFTRTYSTLARWFVIFRAHAWLLSSQSTICKSSVVPAFAVEFPMSGWVCQWKPLWIPVGESFKKAYLEEWIYTGDDSSDEQGFAKFPALVQSTGNKSYIHEDASPAPGPARQPDSLPWEPTGPQDGAYFWESNEAQLPPLLPRCNFIHTRQISPFPERLKLPFSSDEILSGF